MCSSEGTLTAVSQHIFFSKLDSVGLTLLSEKKAVRRGILQATTGQRLRQGGQVFCRREMYSLFPPQTNQYRMSLAEGQCVNEETIPPSPCLTLCVLLSPSDPTDEWLTWRKYPPPDS